MRYVLISLLLYSCYGTFRTARAVEKGRWNLSFCLVKYDGQNNRFENYDSPFLALRKGIGMGRDIGVKLFYTGFEFLFYKQLNFDKYPPYFSSGIQLGIGYPILEVDYIISKEFSFLTPYVILKVAGIPKLWGIWGGAGGIEIDLSHYHPGTHKTIPLYFLCEIFFGKLQTPPCFDCSPLSYGKAIGFGLKIEF